MGGDSRILMLLQTPFAERKDSVNSRFTPGWDYLWQIAAMLEQAHLAHITEEMIEQACTTLQKAFWGWVTSVVFLVLSDFLPERCLEYDSELDNVDEAAEIVQMYARATGGEWSNAQARATLLPERADGRWEALDFVCQGTSYHWEFHTVTADGTGRSWEWGGQFFVQLDEILKKHLTGAFFQPWLGGQGGYGCYLPRPVANQLANVQESMEARFGWDGFAAFVQTL